LRPKVRSRSTELVEMAGFTGITANPGPFGPRHFQFDDGHGQVLPPPDAAGFHNFPVQSAVDARLNAIPEYLEKFGLVFNGGAPLRPGGITISMRRRAIAEFQTTLTAANAPLDRFARGNKHAMTILSAPRRCVTLEAAIAHHLDVKASLQNYDPDANNLPLDLFPGPFGGILAAGINPLLQNPIRLTKKEFRDLVEFVRDGLFDKRVLEFCRQIPRSVPSGMALQFFEGCE
jgi:Di-haem cytochrome c peroxidase